MRKFNLFAIFALMLATTLALPSCKDDDKTDTPDNPSNNEEEGEAIEGAEANAKAVKFWDVASQLVGTGAYTIDYADATFEPTIGTADGNTRIVLVNDMQAAAQKFADITGADIDEETASYTYNDPEIGTLTYTKVDDGTTWATVDVSIKQIPHLEKIIFRNSTDDNGSFGEQKAWYRFGDVVKRTNTDGEVEYWICVRPAFTYEKKEESHWVCVSKLSKSNIYSYSYKAQNTNYYLPTKVGTDKENMQNFAEMLYAICYPQEWYDNALNYHTDKLVGYSGVPIFSDFTSKNLKYHNQYFWQNVQAAWKNNTEIQTSALNLSLSEISSHIKTDGVNLLYKGYSWWKTEGNCDLYNASYTTGTADKEKNLHKADLKTVSAKIYTFDVDCRTMGKDIDKYNKFFNDNKYRWVIRHATGKDLNGGVQPAATAEIQGVTEVYRYYSHYPMEKVRKGKNDSNGPEVSVSSVGKTYYHAGDIIKRNSDGTPWICVRPAGGGLSYKDSYWICLSPFDQNGNCIIEKETTKCGTKDFVYAKNLMSKTTALAASHTFGRLVDKGLRDNNTDENASAVYERLKAANYDLFKLCNDQYNPEVKKGRAIFSFAYGSPIKDPVVATERQYPLQPFITCGISDTHEAVMTYNAQLEQTDDIVCLMSLVDGYEEQFCDKYYKVFGIWNDLYDFNKLLHKYDSDSHQLMFLNNNLSPDEVIGYTWMPASFLHIVISPEIKLADTNNGVRPSSADGFTDVFVSSKDLNGKYFDYWKSLETHKFNFDTKNISQQTIYDNY